MSPPTLDYAPRPEFDTGRFVAIYFQILAGLSVASMILEPILSMTPYASISRPSSCSGPPALSNATARPHGSGSSESPASRSRPMR
jgi:hypothetical protein